MSEIKDGGDHITEMLAGMMLEGRGASEDHAVVMSQIHADAEAITPAFKELVEALDQIVGHCDCRDAQGRRDGVRFPTRAMLYRAEALLSKYTPKDTGNV